jgi:phage-Barnase-EndoU-ColicinE5/D-RelE like nuclease2/Phage Mu protein F like protein
VADTWEKLPFKEAIAFFKQKGALPTRSWRDIEKGAHDRAFVVAGLTRMSALEEIQAVIQRQLESGISFQAFKKQFDTIIDRAGWEPKGGRSWRARLIFETNIRTAHSAGRWAQLQDPAASKALPYIQYRHSGAEHFRPLHKAWDGLVLARTDKFWQTSLPPNGFGCKCQWFALSARSLKRMGKEPDRNPYEVMAEKGGDTTYRVTDRETGDIITLPRGVDRGWDYRPGDAWLRGVTAFPKNATTRNRILPNISWSDAMLPARPFPAEKLLSGALTEEELAARFLAEFGGANGQTAFFDDKIDNVLPISDAWFKDEKGSWKIKKAGRDEWLLAIAQALKDPDEVFALLEWREKEKVWKLKLRYIAQFEVPARNQPLLAIFDRGRDGWEGKTAFIQQTRDRPTYVSDQRQGVRLYRRAQAKK